MMKIKHAIVWILVPIFLASCSSKELITKSVAYQSVRPVNYKAQAPDDAEIILGYKISNEGELTVAVKNNTSEIMIIDQTKSFLVNSDGQSISYYDPTVRVESNTNSTSSSKGGSVNLGAVAGVFGIGGKLGMLANGINVGGSNTDGFSTTNTTYFADQPQISLGPKGEGAMSKTFKIKALGYDNLQLTSDMVDSYTPDNSYCKFSVCISYSIDGGKTFDKIVTDFYSNSRIVRTVKQYGKVNDALRSVLMSKTDALLETWGLLYFNSTLPAYWYRSTLMIDYK